MPGFEIIPNEKRDLSRYRRSSQVSQESSKSSSNLPYAGATGMGALIAAIVSSFSAAFAWIKTKFKNKK